MRSPFLPLLVCALFSLFALAGVLFGEAPRTSLLLYYCLLLLNTFFSVRVFSSITPPNALQAVFDAILVLNICRSRLLVRFGRQFHGDIGRSLSHFSA